MRWFTLSLLIVCLASFAGAHHPDFENQRVWPRIDVIPPVGNNLPMSYRRRYNRPTWLGGWIAYHIAPSSQEAMAWHDAVHERAYADHRGRLEKHYFYPKPWEGLRIGPRISTAPEDVTQRERAEASRELRDSIKAEEEDVLSASDDLPSSSQLIEQERQLQRPASPLPPDPEPPVDLVPIQPQPLELQPADQ